MNKLQLTVLTPAIIISALLSGCADDSVTPPVSSMFKIEPSFQSCDKVVSQPETDELTSQFNCGSVQLPLDWNNKEGQKIDYFVRQLPARETTRAQIWILPGGPGIAGDDYETALALAEALPDTEIYMPDHRGTGRSDFLACNPEQSQQNFSGDEPSGEDCLTYLLENRETDELAHFNVTQAAEDIGQLITHFNPEGNEVYVYGSSYGTYWAQRYLHLYPDQASGVFLDAVCSLTSCYQQNGYFTTADIAGNELLKLCDNDAFCSNKLGGDAKGYLQNLYTLLENGHCPALDLSREDLQFYTGEAVSEKPLQALLPALLYRLTRCNEKDVEAILHLVDYAENGGDEGAESMGDEPQFDSLPESLGLTLNIINSEFWDNGLTPADIEAQAQRALFALDGFGEEEQAAYDLQAQWPIYALDSFAITVNSAAELASQYVQPNQQTILIPYAGHETLGASPIADSDEDCAATLAIQFFQNPQQELDRSCLDNLQALDFEGDPQSAVTAFNTLDYWEN